MAQEKNPKYVVILNFRTGNIDILSLHGMNEDDDFEEFIEMDLTYNLSDCEWMVTTNPFPNPINF
jgi:hypothetical protein